MTPLRIATLAVLVLSLVACGGAKRGFAVSMAKTPAYVSRSDDVNPKLLYEAPNQPFIVVGTIEVRADRPKMWKQFASYLRVYAVGLGADAIIPPDKSAKRDVKFESDSPQRAYYLFDDGKNTVVEGRAIRFIKDQR